MNAAKTKHLTIFAPAKINLYLHITGRLDNGYHNLDSLVAFANIGDQIEIENANNFEFLVKGYYAETFNNKELDSSPNSSNLLVQAVWNLSQAAQKIPDIRATLTKNLPIASGIGGGSSDAAAIIRGLLEWWNLSPQAHYLPELMTNLGADVPVCFHCKPSHIQGIGDILNPAPRMNKIPIILVNPNKACSTADIFRHHKEPFKEPQSLPENLMNFDTLISFLKHQDNDLLNAALVLVPEITNIINSLNAQKGCAIAHMSGSGATCFALFKHKADAEQAAKTLASKNPNWWVKSGYLNQP